MEELNCRKNRSVVVVVVVISSSKAVKIVSKDQTLASVQNEKELLISNLFIFPTHTFFPFDSPWLVYSRGDDLPPSSSSSSFADCGRFLLVCFLSVVVVCIFSFLYFSRHPSAVEVSGRAHRRHSVEIERAAKS